METEKESKMEHSIAGDRGRLSKRCKYKNTQFNSAGIRLHQCSKVKIETKEDK
jgi:hypothetical protein